MLAAVYVENIWAIFVKLGKRPDTEGREKLTLIEHISQHPFHPRTICDRKQSPLLRSGRPCAADVGRDIRAILDEPLHSFLERGQTIDQVALDRRHREERDQP